MYICQNMYYTNPEVLKKLEYPYRKLKLITQKAVICFLDLVASIHYPDIIDVTKEKQYRSQGLLYISDIRYKFFLMSNRNG